MADSYRNLTEAQKALTPLERVLAGTYQMVPYDAATNRGLYEDGHRLLYDAMMADAAALTEQMGATAAAILIGSLTPRTVVRLTSASFYETGNKAADYPANRAVVLAQTSSGVGYVASATYNSGADRTEVTVTGITVDTGLTQAVLGLDPKYAPKIPTSLTAAANSIPIAGAGGALDESWVPPADWKATTAFSRTGAGSGTVTNNTANQALFRPGRPLRALSGSTYTYHIVTAYSAGAVTVAGPALPATVDALAYGDMSRVIQETFSFNGYFADAADSALIEHDLLARYLWSHGRAYCVHFSVRPLVDDSGAAQPRVNVSCAGSAVSTSNSNAGLAVNDSAWVETAVDISAANYDITWGETLEVAVDANGTSDNARDLTVIAVFVLE
ncbi:MAG: hypothetical protein FD177_988 [Desulfovibrionaceae bacterium]|nr:MAG: hypothetical protein FD177_988 [Desulfovibrionaceae bacterium]